LKQYSRHHIPIPTKQTDHKQVIDDFPINPQETLIMVQDELVSPTRQALLKESRPTRKAFENKSRGIENHFFPHHCKRWPARWRPSMTHC
jgi:hypothetical protein